MSSVTQRSHTFNTHMHTHTHTHTPNSHLHHIHTYSKLVPRYCVMQCNSLSALSSMDFERAGEMKDKHRGEKKRGTLTD